MLHNDIRIQLQCYYKLINFYDIIFFLTISIINDTKLLFYFILFYYRPYMQDRITTTHVNKQRRSENFIQERYAMKDFSLFRSTQRKCLAHDRQHINVDSWVACSHNVHVHFHVRQKHTHPYTVPIAAFSPLLVYHDNNLNEVCLPNACVLFN